MYSDLEIMKTVMEELQVAHTFKRRARKFKHTTAEWNSTLNGDGKISLLSVRLTHWCLN